MSNTSETTFKTALRIARMSDDEFIAYFQAQNAERRHVLLLYDLEKSYRSAKSGKSFKRFMLQYPKLKRYMSLHRWSKDFILAEFGVSFKSMTRLYFDCVNKYENSLAVR